MTAEIGALCLAARQGEAPIYGALLRENVMDALAASFPDTHARLGPEKLGKLASAFMARHGALDPQFHRVATEFVAFAQSRRDLSQTLLAGMEYEWLQLAVEIDTSSVPEAPPGGAWPGDQPLMLNPTARFVMLPFDLTREDSVATANDGRLPYALYRTADHHVVTQPLTRQDCLLIEMFRDADALTPDALVRAVHVWSEEALRGWAADAINRCLLIPNPID